MELPKLDGSMESSEYLKIYFEDRPSYIRSFLKLTSLSMTLKASVAQWEALLEFQFIQIQLMINPIYS